MRNGARLQKAHPLLRENRHRPRINKNIFVISVSSIVVSCRYHQRDPQHTCGEIQTRRIGNSENWQLIGSVGLCSFTRMTTTCWDVFVIAMRVWRECAKTKKMPFAPSVTSLTSESWRLSCFVKLSCIRAVRGHTWSQVDIYEHTACQRNDALCKRASVDARLDANHFEGVNTEYAN